MTTTNEYHGVFMKISQRTYDFAVEVGVTVGLHVPPQGTEFGDFSKPSRF